MGQGLLLFYRNKVQKRSKIAFFSTFVIGLLVHLYKFTNTLPNHDSLFNFYSSQNIVGSGRWFLSIACGFSSYFDLPWVNGVLSLLFIALTMVVLVDIFEMKNPILIVLSGAVLVSFPSITETFFFEFTADGYMLAMLLAAVAVYLTHLEETRVSRWGLSGVCICLSCAIYQAYVSFALVLTLLYFIYDLLENRHETKAYLKWIRNQIIVYAVSLAAYYVIWKICMKIEGVTVNDYQGISEVGKISAALIWSGFKNVIRTPLFFFLQWNVFEHGVTLYALLNIIFLLVMTAILVTACVKSKIIRRKAHLALFLLDFALLFPCACIWHFTSESVGYRPMMLTSLALLYIFTALLFERWGSAKWSNVAGGLFTVIVFNFVIMANISYYYMNLCYERTYADGIEMMNRIHEIQEEYEISNIAVVGNRIYDVQLKDVDEKTGAMNPSGKIHILSGVLEENLLYDQYHTVYFLDTVLGLDLEPITKDELETLEQTEMVSDMGVWPAPDSVTVMDRTLVLKLCEPEGRSS